MSKFETQFAPGAVVGIVTTVHGTTAYGLPETLRGFVFGEVVERRHALGGAIRYIVRMLGTDGGSVVTTKGTIRCGDVVDLSLRGWGIVR